MNRIDKKFLELRSQGNKAFIAFITAGFPSLEVTARLIEEFSRRGVDIVELGVPFTDPVADGPVIQQASFYALKRGVNLSKILALVKRVRLKTEIPICLMTYYNPVFCYGEERFIKEAKECGVDGLIIPDLPPEEAVGLRRMAIKAGLDVINFVAPTTSKERLPFILKTSTGFIYYVSLTGVTGERRQLPPDLLINLKRLRTLTLKPVCVGFGISHPLQIRRICQVADGVIVGSAIVKQIMRFKDEKGLVLKVADYLTWLKRG